MKEYLSVRGIGFESVNVLEGDGMARLEALGARSVPVVSRGGDFVFAQVIRDVVEFLGLDDDAGPRLSPAELAGRYRRVLRTAVRLVRQMPDGLLENQLPDRPRSWRVLMHHVFQIPAAFLDMEESGVPMRYEDMVAPPPDGMRSSAQIAAFGERVLERFERWWDEAASGSDFGRTQEVYFGAVSRHEMLERTVWHSTQHVRQLTSLLERSSIEPDAPLAPGDLAGLPLTEKVWDEG